MPIWGTTDVELQPELILISWSIMLVNGVDWHFVGYAPQNYEGRTSSRIEEFDLANHVGRSKSGRLYRLNGGPGYNSDAEYTFRRWCDINSVQSVEEITDRVLSGELVKA
ncbi:hypothetical protein [Nitrogeniibacter aestuarii]|uniref:hypothetical protein n=1 Tax=Nitrogeniibacter aestuarii TaxID=2815343 RepID=UPI001D1058AE|nr:hypothetical protein [Nitrogeniibacter aestuarii]